jgi:hypothetical protein
MHIQFLLAQFLSSPRSYSLPKSTTYTEEKNTILWTPIVQANYKCQNLGT